MVIGLGSIGRRHLQNLLALNYKDVSVVTSKPPPTEFPLLDTFANLDDALVTQHFEAAFICTPTSYHLEALYNLLQAEVENIYVEKPLSHNTANIGKALQLAAAYNVNIKVGYDLHFHPCILKIKELLDAQTIGRLVSINAFVGQHLPLWRPYEDHRKGMSAKHETGGGVLLDIVHEFDYLRWLAGSVQCVACHITNTGTLEIETEEVAEVLLKFENGVVGTVHLDYLQPELVRHCTFTGTKGTITANLAKNVVQWMRHDGTGGEASYAGFERNDRFKQIIKAFLENETDERLTSLSDSLHSLAVVEAAKRSAHEGCFIKTNSITYN